MPISSHDINRVHINFNSWFADPCINIYFSSPHIAVAPIIFLLANFIANLHLYDFNCYLSTRFFEFSHLVAVRAMDGHGLMVCPIQSAHALPSAYASIP